MLNNGHVPGMGTPDNGHPGGMYGQPDYSPHHSPYMNGPPPPGMNIKQEPMQHNIKQEQMQGMGHHSGGGICSPMTPMQNACNVKGLQQCYGCAGPIMERYLLYSLERYWHQGCLRCSACQCELFTAGHSCFTRDGMILCKQDYLKIFGSRGACHGCRQGIAASEMVMRAGVSPPGSAPPLVYHLHCFKCSKCSALLHTGERYSLLNGALYCEQDALKQMKNGIASPATNGPTGAAPTRKGKVGRPRRSRD